MKADVTGVSSQLTLWNYPEPTTIKEIKPDLESYDRVVLFMSGGKDSIAALLHLIDEGVDPDKIELHHHIVDGREGSTLMDWPVTEAYCEAFAKQFGFKLFNSWKVGGFEREMLRNQARTAPIAYEKEDGNISITGGEGGSFGTRLKFPQVAADLRVRWCSAYLKIDVGARVLTGESRFQEGKTLVVTGERAEESPSRARYSSFEMHRCDNRKGTRVKRYIDHWRPIHAWKEKEVWDILKKHRVNPHPAYWLGWGRTSCMTCIFGSANQWATIKTFMPEAFERIASYEEKFQSTIQRSKSVKQLADSGVPYPCDKVQLAIAMNHKYTDQIIVNGEWNYPPGAFGESSGPT